MKAIDARKLAEDAVTTAIDPQQLTAALGPWHAAITRAAKNGRSSVTRDECDRPRCPISDLAHRAALAQLQTDGFTVKEVVKGNRETIEVSW